MCWVSCRVTKQVAKRDFYVYKIGIVIGTTFCSLLRKHIYRTKGVNIPILLEPKRDNRSIMTSIERGYHSYKEVALEFTSYYKESWRRIYLGDAVRGYVDDLTFYDKRYLGTFIVPKGSEYYINNRGEIVSSNIIYTGKWVKL
mgnify:CR=1 FL=1